MHRIIIKRLQNLAFDTWFRRTINFRLVRYQPNFIKLKRQNTINLSKIIFVYARLLNKRWAR